MDDDFDFHWTGEDFDDWLGASLEGNKIEIMCADNARVSLPREEAVKLALWILSVFPDALPKL